jgi:hypothetical protein
LRELVRDLSNVEDRVRAELGTGADVSDAIGSGPHDFAFHSDGSRTAGLVGNDGGAQRGIAAT